MKKRFLHSILLLLSLSLAACSDSDTKESPGEGDNGGLVCSLTGTWVRCDVDGAQSQKITLQVNGSTLNETIEAYGSNDSCSGIPDGNFAITGTMVLGESAASQAIIGATDVDLTTAEDIGCGAGNTSYTALKFSDTCDEFFSANEQPGCDANSRGSTLSTNPFIKQ